MNVHTLKSTIALALLCVFFTGCGKKQAPASETQPMTTLPPATEVKTEPETTAPDAEYPPLEFYGDDSVSAEPDFTSFAGCYDGEGAYRELELDGLGNFRLYRNPGEDPAVMGQIVYVCKPEFYAFYAYDSAEEVYRKVIYADEQQIEIASYGKFLLISEPQETQPAEGDFSHFEGAWYLDGNIAGDCYLLIDLYGYWSYFDGGEMADLGKLEQTGTDVTAIGGEGQTYEIELVSDAELTFDGRSFLKDES